MDSALVFLGNLKLILIELDSLMTSISNSLGFNPVLVFLVIFLVSITGKILFSLFPKLIVKKKAILILLSIVYSIMLILVTHQALALNLLLYKFLVLSALTSFNYQIVKLVITGLYNYMITKLNSKFEKDIEYIKDDELMP